MRGNICSNLFSNANEKFVIFEEQLKSINPMLVNNTKTMK